MSDESLSTVPKPFIFVLMPFNEDFDDIYISGIKEAATEAGAYAERVDEQNYKEGILERIFNQINKADVIVADMTGRNPNVFYEVGYAHALGKVVLLLTQKADDIPFDLKHRQHIVYGTDGGKIKNLRNQLSPKLTWAIDESKKKEKVNETKRISVSVSRSIEIPRNIMKYNKDGRFIEIEEDRFSESIPTIDLYIETLEKSIDAEFNLRFHVYNNSTENIPTITHIYSFAASGMVILPSSSCMSAKYHRITVAYNPEKDKLPYKYCLNLGVTAIPPNATEAFEIAYKVYKNNLPNFDNRLHASYELKPELHKLRIHILNDYYDFSFLLKGTINVVDMLS
jgi:Nucleoside 2-deoxyribosyltransferase.